MAKPSYFVKTLTTTFQGKSLMFWPQAIKILTQIYDISGLLYSSAGALTVIYDAATGLEVQVLSEHTDQIIDSAYDNQSELFATQSVDGTVKLWARNFGSVN